MQTKKMFFSKFINNGKKADGVSVETQNFVSVLSMSALFQIQGFNNSIIQ